MSEDTTTISVTEEQSEELEEWKHHEGQSKKDALANLFAAADGNELTPDALADYLVNEYDLPEKVAREVRGQ